MSQIEQACGTCQHHTAGTQPKCGLPLPWWAEPYQRPLVYQVEGGDCPAYERRASLGD